LGATRKTRQRGGLEHIAECSQLLFSQVML